MEDYNNININWRKSCILYSLFASQLHCLRIIAVIALIASSSHGPWGVSLNCEICKVYLLFASIELFQCTLGYLMGGVLCRHLQG